MPGSGTFAEFMKRRRGAQQPDEEPLTMEMVQKYREKGEQEGSARAGEAILKAAPYVAASVLVPEAVAGLAAGAVRLGVPAIAAKAATSPLAIGGGRTVAGLATGESIPQALLEGVQAAGYARAGKGAGAAAGAAKEAAKVATDHRVLNAFARTALGSKAKIGEKVHLLLDQAGKPLAVLTPGEAAAATRLGKATTWIRLMGSVN